ASRISAFPAAAAATPTIRLAVETIPSLAPRTAARSQPIRLTAWRSLCGMFTVAPPQSRQNGGLQLTQIRPKRLARFVLHQLRAGTQRSGFQRFRRQPKIGKEDRASSAEIRPYDHERGTLVVIEQAAQPA